ncbi:hypothetical protein FACS1894208_10950 [Clostridia bacterium]|nr:hypothetical protein FACS1894208_10950 [Clostridia bacterium]
MKTETNPIETPRMFSARDLTAIIGSRAIAYKLFGCSSFPAVRLGKRIFVREDSFWKWWSEHEGQFVDIES